MTANKSTPLGMWKVLNKKLKPKLNCGEILDGLRKYARRPQTGMLERIAEVGDGFPETVEELEEIVLAFADSNFDGLISQQEWVTSVVYSGCGGASISVSEYPPAGAQYANIPPNVERLVLGCIEADFCK